MKLGFDATALTAAGKGVARFQLEFLRAAAEHDLVQELDVFLPPEPTTEALPERSGWRYHRVAARPMIVWEQLRRPALARRLGVDCVITPSERAALWGPPELAYIYEHPRHRIARTREVSKPGRQRLVDAVTRVLFEISMRKAAVVVAASEATARDLAGIRAAPVVYSGVSERFSPDERERTHLLHLASDDPRDNSAVVIEAYAAYGEDRPPLVVAGPLRLARPALERRAEELGVAASIDWRGFQTSEQLVELYRGSIAYVDPSLYEGFGLQAAEALACGTPVVASNRTSLPEVVGDAGFLLDPHDVAGFAAALRRLVDDDRLRQDLSRRAVAQAERFTWKATVRALVAVAAGAVEPARNTKPRG